MIGKQISRMNKLAEDANKLDPNKEDILVLFADPHPFKSEIYLSVMAKVPEAKNISLTGTFMSKVFDGDYNAIPKFMKEMDIYLGSKNKRLSGILCIMPIVLNVFKKRTQLYGDVC